MLDDKMALLPLKISDAYLLVWGVLCLVIGISLFGQYSYGWLASISAVMLGTSTVFTLFREYRPVQYQQSRSQVAITVSIGGK